MCSLWLSYHGNARGIWCVRLLCASLSFHHHRHCCRCSPPKTNPVTAWAEGLDSGETILLLNLYLPPAIYSPDSGAVLSLLLNRVRGMWLMIPHHAFCLEQKMHGVFRASVSHAHTRTRVSHTEGRVPALYQKKRREIIGGCIRLGTFKWHPMFNFGKFQLITLIRYLRNVLKVVLR